MVMNNQTLKLKQRFMNTMNNVCRQQSSLLSFVMLATILFALIAQTASAATTLTATVDRNPVMENESFVLQLVVNDSVDSDDLDLSLLKQSGLLVGRTNTSSQTQIINGSISKSTTWNVVMLARNAGEYRIPSLEIDGAKSQPIVVKVIKSKAQAGQQTQPIFLKNNIENDSLYLQQTTKLVTRLYFAPNVDLQSGTLTDPSLNTATIKQQGKDTETSEIIMGARYRVIERIYTVTPQSSGEFTITSPTFNGEVSTDRRRSVFSNFGNRKPISSIGNDISINVEPIPDDYSGTWLPSDLVQLHEEWQPNQDTYDVGEPITRTFTLTALNVNEEQLPDIKGEYPAIFNMYPDQSESHSAVRQNAIVSQRVSSEAIVATKAGTYTLPAVALNWFNTQTNRLERAVIPEKVITIVAAETQNENTLVSNIPLQAQAIPTSETNCPVPSAEDNTSALSCPDISEQVKVNWLITAAGWLLWLITSVILLIVLKKQKSVKAPVSAQVDKSSPQSFNKKALKSACDNNDVNLVRNELINWAKQEISPNVKNLQGLVAQLQSPVGDELVSEISALNQSQYGQQRSDWSGAALWQAFNSYVKTHQSGNTNDNSDLPPLN